jgi:hypothetical protein
LPGTGPPNLTGFPAELIFPAFNAEGIIAIPAVARVAFPIKWRLLKLFFIVG